MRSGLFFAALSAVLVSAQTLEEKIRTAKNAISQVQRINALADTDFVFDFVNPPQASISQGAGGRTVAATASSFPGIIGNGVAMTIGFMGPCGFNTPHTHPRATEFNFAVNGTLRTGMLQENGARYVFNTVPPGSATIFPKGAIHFEMNDGCEPMIFVAAFNDEDPGTSGIAQRFFGLTPEYVAATLGDFGVEEVEDIDVQIPNNIALGIDACLQRCGIPKGTSQPTSQRQPRIATNQFPGAANSQGNSPGSQPAPGTGMFGIPYNRNTYNRPPSGNGSPPSNPPPSNPPPSGSNSGTYPQPSTNSAANAPSRAAHHSGGQQQQPVSALGGFAAQNDSSSGGGRGSDPVMIALLVIVSLMALGYIAIGAVWFMDRRKAQNNYGGRGTGFNPLREKGHQSTYSLGGGGAKYDDPHMEYTDSRAMMSPPPPQSR